MKNRFFTSAILLGVISCTLLVLNSCQTNKQFDCIDLRCEYLNDPIAINPDNIRFSWEIEASEPDYKQYGYEIKVASKESKLFGKADVWMSGIVQSSETNQIEYNGPDLQSNTIYYWIVRSRNQDKQPGGWSRPAAFRTTYDKNGWQAKWIGLPVSTAESNNYTIPPSPMIRKVFIVEKPVDKAFITSTAKGVYELAINGEKVGDHYLAPGWTDFAQRIKYQTHEVSNLINDSKNCISVILSDGWFAGRLGSIDFGFNNYPWRGWYGRDLRFVGQLEIWYTDGTSVVIPSDESWSCYSDGPFRSADNFIGVTYDFNYELEGWMEPEFDQSEWSSAVAEDVEFEILEPQMDQGIKAVRILDPVSVQERNDGVVIVDMGQNMVGWLELTLKGNAGDSIVLKHAEMLNDNGLAYRDNLRNAPQIDIYILKDDQEQSIEPLFTFHGFRYVQIEGLHDKNSISNIKGKVLVSATPETGHFECSNQMLNKLFENIRWTQWGNQISIPTDCPQRSERMGWMGDAQVFAQTAIYNHDMSAFYTKWGQDIMDAQFETGEFSDVSPRGMPMEPRFINAPGWADAGLIVPFRLYENYGDEKVIERHYESMKKYIDRIHELNPDLIYLNGTGHAYNDWLNGNTIISDDYPKSGGEIPRPVFNTAFFIRSTRLLAKAAEISGHSEDQAFYTGLANETLVKFQEEFLQEDGSILGNTQAGYAIALNFDLVPEEMRMLVAQKLVQAIEAYDNRMSTGFISTICMMDELSKMGYHELACQLAESTRLPSWGYSIEQGATTIWERWDAYVKGRGFQNAGMNSFNHYTFGSVGEWMYKHVLGISRDENSPGWRHFYLEPKMGGSLIWAKGHYKSINGMISMEWKLNKNILDLEFEIPANTTATFIMPQGHLTEVTIDDEKLINIPPDRKILLNSGLHKVHMISR